MKSRFSNGAHRNGVLLSLGYSYSMITIALVAACFGVTENTARPKPGGLTHNADQTQEASGVCRPRDWKGKTLDQCFLAYSSSSLSSSLLSCSPLVSRKPWVLPFWSVYAPTMSPSGFMPNGRVFLALAMSIGVNCPL